MTDFYTTAGLKKRGWTDCISEQHLGKPDGVCANPQGELRARIKLFALHRVHKLESGTAKADLEKISDARDLPRRARAFDEREKLFTSRWIIH